MCLEQLSTRYLAALGKSTNADLETKLNMCNAVLRCLPRQFRRALSTVRERLRNPLFHEGATAEEDTMKLYAHLARTTERMCRHDLCHLRYRGSIQLQDFDKGERVISVDEMDRM
jgi:hypothetical protein